MSFVIPSRSINLGDLTYSLLEESAVHCLVDCCGLNAIEFSEASLDRWRDKHTGEEWVMLLKEYQQLITDIQEFASPVQCLGNEYTTSELTSEFDILNAESKIIKQT